MMRQSAANVRFADLERVVFAMGYRFDRQAGSHRIYRSAGLPMINLQEDGGKAKSYQVKQVIGIVDQFGIEV